MFRWKREDGDSTNPLDPSMSPRLLLSVYTIDLDDITNYRYLCSTYMNKDQFAHLPCVSNKSVPLVSKTRPKGTENNVIALSVELK